MNKAEITLRIKALNAQAEAHFARADELDEAGNDSLALEEENKGARILGEIGGLQTELILSAGK